MTGNQLFAAGFVLGLLVGLFFGALLVANWLQGQLHEAIEAEKRATALHQSADKHLTKASEAEDRLGVKIEEWAANNEAWEAKAAKILAEAQQG